jgi:transcriptional regulator with GAF, ATPase, and Fis domain
VRELIAESNEEDDAILTEQDIVDLQKVNLRKAMDQCDWKISGKEGAAALLGIKPSTLSYRLNQWDVRRD